MRAWGLGLEVAALAVVLGCGITEVEPKKTDVGASSTAGGGGASGSGGKQGSGTSGAEAMGAQPGASGSATGGRPTLPPDGEVPPAVALGKLDVLVVVDNSRNMRDKQRLLDNAVGWLVTEVAEAGISDIHVGIITSSLGSHGATGTKDVCVAPRDDDHARLLPSVRPELAAPADFLSWGPNQDADALSQMLKQLTPMMDAVGEAGCGYEAPLEAWYRFLVQPDPPASVVVDPSTQLARPEGVDDVLLAQRASFLRDDSVLAIVMASDENDCSIVDDGYGWLISRNMPIFRATSACDSNPNDPCCQSCGESRANAGCPAIDGDAACLLGRTLAGDEDDLNLRCWDQQRRFGFELLQPVSRYTDALTRQFVLDRNGMAFQNPLFAGSATRRHPSQVILTGIVGVPWQDVADEASWSQADRHVVLDGMQLEQQKRWPVMLGDPRASPPVRPTDPFMLETTADRTSVLGEQQHPLVAEMLASAASLDPRANAINGHETMQGGRELQTACIFPLETPRTCDQAAADAAGGCLCFSDQLQLNRAACQPPGGGAATTTQQYAVAYPSLRQLQVLQSLGSNAITGSICPKFIAPASGEHGYLPIARTTLERLKSAFAP